MFIFNLFLLPIRGLWAMFTGLLMSLPIWIIVALYTLHYWLPIALNQWIYQKTGFVCHVESCELNVMQGDFIFKNVVLNNAYEFNSADWLKIKELSFKIPFLSFFKEKLEFDQITLDFERFVSVNDSGKNNIQQFVACLMQGAKSQTNFSKRMLIRDLNVRMNGLIGFRYDAKNEIRTQERFFEKNYNFSNVCLNMSLEQQNSLMNATNLEAVYNNIAASLLNSLQNK